MRGVVVVVCALSIATCGSDRDADDAAPPAPAIETSSPAGLTQPLFRSGARLKVRWAAASSEVRVVESVFDTRLQRVCELAAQGSMFVCVPEADAHLRHEDIAYLYDDRVGPARIVDKAECAADAPDTALYTASLYPNEKLFPELLHAGSARFVDAAWLPAGGGCVPDHELANERVCVRPLRAADLELVRFRETVLTRPGSASGVVVAVGDDGSILSWREMFHDAAHDIDCSIDDERCLPAAHDELLGTPVVGGQVAVLSYQRNGHAWAATRDETTWAVIGSAPGLRNEELRTVRSLFAPNDALQLSRVVIGEGRIVLRARVTPDGRRVPVTLHDTTLGQDCVATKMDDGTWRCTPRLPLLCDVVGAPPDWRPIGLGTKCYSDRYCCHGGTFWFPGRPPEPPQRYGIGPHAQWIPATKGYGARFASEASDVVTSPNGPGAELYTHNVYRKLEDIDAGAFARLELIEEP